jgi:hypothetical protein
LIFVKKLIKKQEGTWKKVSPEAITESDLDNLIIVTESGKQFVIKERKSS